MTEHFKSKREHEDHIKHLEKETHFDSEEVRLLEAMFHMCSTEKNGEEFLSRAVFRDIFNKAFGLCDDLMLDRTFSAFSSLDGAEKKLGATLWVKGMSIYLRGTLEERIGFNFMVFDIDGNGEISRDEMYALLANTIVKAPSEEDRDEAIRDLIEIVLKKMDLSTPKTQTSKISQEDFKTSVLANNLLLEVFGRCLPTNAQAKDFVTLKMKETIRQLFGGN